MPPIKPPLGIMPEDLWREHRVLDLARAIAAIRDHLIKYERTMPATERQKYLDLMCNYGRQLRDMPVFTIAPF